MSMLRERHALKINLLTQQYSTWQSSMDLTPETYNIFLAVLSSGIAALTGVAAYFAATTQNRIAASTAAAEWIRDLRDWSSEVIEIMSEAAAYCPRELASATDSEQALIKRCRCRLSALADRGRLLLPNTHGEFYGERKERAYRGYRHQALDALIAAERVLDGKTPLFDFPDPKVALIGIRREFVSIMQGILDPASTNRSIANLLRSAQEDRKSDATIGGLLPDSSSVPAGAEGLLYLASRRYTASNRKYGDPLERTNALPH